MKKTTKYIILGIITVIAIFLAGISSIYIYLTLSPERLGNVVEGRMEKITGSDVYLGDASLKRAHIILGDVRMGRPDRAYLSSPRIDIRFRPWNIFAGKFNITKISIFEPRVMIDLDSVSGGEKSETTYGFLPVIKVVDGSLFLRKNGIEVYAGNINAKAGSRKVLLNAEVLGGAALAELTRTRDGWKGRISLDNTCINNITPGVTGYVSLDTEFDSTGGRVNLSGKDLVFPALSIPGEISISSDVSRNDGNIRMENLFIKTPVVRLSGSAAIDAPGGLEDISSMGLRFEMSSAEFDYDDFVNSLPVDTLNKAIATFLTEQLRGGTSRFIRIAYDGSVSGLKDKNTLAKKLYVEEELSGQRFCAGFGPETVERINGRVFASNGNVEFRNLSGYSGDSRIKDIDLSFLDYASPGMRLKIGVDVDVAAKDYVDAWRAIMTTQPLHDMMNPVGEVGGGRVIQKTVYEWDSEGRNPRIRGNLRTENLSLEAGSLELGDIDATMSAETYTSPVVINLSGKIGETKLDRAEIELEDPFGKMEYTFTASTECLPENDEVMLDAGSRLEITGSGAKKKIKGRLALTTSGVTVSGNHLRFNGNGLRATGDVSGSFDNGTELEIKRLDFLGLNLDAEISGNSGSVSVSGVSDASRLSTLHEGAFVPLQGRIGLDAQVSWKDKEFTRSGSIEFFDTRIHLNDNVYDFDGKLSLKDSLVETQGLKTVYKGIVSDIKGTLTLSEIPFFRGEFSVTGARIGEKTPFAEMMDKFSADVKFSLKESTVFDIPVEEASARMRLSGGKLRISDLALEGTSGTIEGDLTVSMGGGSDFDITLSLNNADIDEFYHAMRNGKPGKFGINGKMFLSGRLWGKPGDINGDIILTAMDGHIRNYSFLSRIFGALNLYKMVKSREFDFLGTNGYTYNLISATFSIRDSVARFEDFYLDSNSVQLSAVGEFSIKDKTLDAHIGVQPLETIDKTLSYIPLVGWVLTGEDGKLIVLTLSATGTIDDLTILPAPVETMSRPVSGTLLRILKLPVDIITQPGKVIIPGNGKKK